MPDDDGFRVNTASGLAPVDGSLTRQELEAEIARLRAALEEAGINAQRVGERQAERDGQRRADLAVSHAETARADQRIREAQSDAHGVAHEHQRQMADAMAGLIAPQDLVAELKISQAALASSEARQRAIFESAIDFAMVITDSSGIITDWNLAAEHVMGWTAAEMRGWHAERFFTPEDRTSDRLATEMQRALREGRASNERWHLRKSGQRFWASGEIMPLFDASHVHLGFITILRDRTEDRPAGAALKEAQERFQSILNTIDAAFAVVQVKFDAEDRPVDYCFLEANPAFERQAGVNLRGKWVTEFAPDLERFWFETYGHVAKTGEPANFENYAEAFKRWFDVRAVRVGAPADRQIAILFNDVTARHEAEERLRASEALARENVERVQLALAAGAIVGTWHWDIRADRFKVDEAFAQAFGLDPDLGREGIPLAHIVATVHPDDQAGLAEAIDAAVAKGGAYARQYRVRRVDGEYHWIEANGRVNRGPDGEPLSFPGVLIDVEERRAVERERDRAIAALRALNETLEQRVEERTRELHDAQDFSRLALSSVGGVGAWTYDVSSEQFFCSPAIADLYGLDPVRAGRGIGRMEFIAHVHPDDKAALLATMADGLEKPGDIELEYRIRPPDGSIRWVLSRGHTYQENGKPTRRVGIGVETTKQHQLEEQLRQSQKMEAVGQLTGDLAHDFNNLLTGISGALELMGTRIAQGRLGDIDKYMVAAQDAARRAAALTHRLLAFSRRQTLDPGPTNVNTLVEEMTELIQRTVGPSIFIETVGATGLWPALVDASQLENALLNLCINARDAMPEGGRITVQTANRWMDRETASAHDMPEGHYLSLSVSDTGTGMPPEVIARVFEPFFTTKPIGRGTGLGLSMIYGFAQQSGGQVRIYSEVGKGTTVYLYMPRHFGNVQMDKSGPDQARAAFAPHGETVLIVDDEPTVRMLVTDILGDLGYVVIEAADSVAGLRVLRSDTHIDLLISDVGLPGGMNGRQMADAGREIRPELKTLFITGYAENAAIKNGHLEPGMHMLTKPFAVDTLAARVRELIRR